MKSIFRKFSVICATVAIALGASLSSPTKASADVPTEINGCGYTCYLAGWEYTYFTYNCYSVANTCPLMYEA
jgi:hypothetical protein